MTEEQVRKAQSIHDRMLVCKRLLQDLFKCRVHLAHLPYAESGKKPFRASVALYVEDQPTIHVEVDQETTSHVTALIELYFTKRVEALKEEFEAL